MQQGTITKLVADWEFGFLSAEDGDLVFHASAVHDTVFEQLHEGQTVEYKRGTGAQGKPCATLVKPVGMTNA